MVRGSGFRPFGHFPFWSDGLPSGVWPGAKAAVENISFTTFLKVSLLPTTQGKLGLVHRMTNSPGGYDFYKRMKLAAQRVAAGEVNPEEVFAELETIKRQAERTHNLLMAQRFWAWWSALENATVLEAVPKGVYRTPAMNFGIRIAPELAHNESGESVITYLWATRLPRLSRQVAGMGILLMKAQLSTAAPNARLQIYDLRQERCYTEEEITNQSPDLLAADIALLNSIWPDSLSKAA